VSQSSPESKSRYATSEKGRETKRRYNRTPKGRARAASYESSDKARARKRRYNKSPKGREAKGRYRETAIEVRLGGRTFTYRVRPDRKAELQERLATFRENQREEYRRGRID
jgi:hypothetical protein